MNTPTPTSARSQFKLSSASSSSLWNDTFDSRKTSDFSLDTVNHPNFLPKSELQRLVVNSPLQDSSSTSTGASSHKQRYLPRRQYDFNSISNHRKRYDHPWTLRTSSSSNRSGSLHGYFSVSHNNQEPGLRIQSPYWKDEKEPVSLQHFGNPQFLKARPTSHGLRGPLRQNLTIFVEEGIPKPVNSYSWPTAIFTQIKPDGQTPILGVNSITINKQVLQPKTTIPPMEDIFQDLWDKDFIKIDLTHVFLPIPFSDGAKEDTTINTPFKLFQYQFLPFRLNVSPRILQRTINQIITGLEGRKTNQVDIIVYSNPRQEHDERLLALLKVLNKFRHSRTSSSLYFRLQGFSSFSDVFNDNTKLLRGRRCLI